MDHLSFDSLAEIYDRTRICDQGCFDSAIDYIVEKFPPRAHPKLIEPGVGTGRIALPLADRGYRVAGVDVSEKMLEVLRSQTRGECRPLDIQAINADATNLPFADGSFNVGVAVHLFYWIRDWKKAADELLRVVRDDGPIVLMHTGTGTEVPFMAERYKELCRASGHCTDFVGASSTKDVVAYYEGRGCRAEWTSGCWTWTTHIRLDEALDYIRRRAYSFTTIPPEDAHHGIVDALESELRDRFGSLEEVTAVPNQVYLVAITRPGFEDSQTDVEIGCSLPGVTAPPFGQASQDRR